jgi:hypothetical protein
LERDPVTATLTPVKLEPAEMLCAELGSTGNAPPELTAELAILVSLWRAWSAAPGGEFRAGRLEDQVQRVAVMTGTTGSKLREWCIVNRAMVGLR